MFLLSCDCLRSASLPRGAMGLFVIVDGHTHLLFKVSKGAKIQHT